MSHGRPRSKLKTRRPTAKRLIIREQLSSLRLVIGSHLSDLMRESNNNGSITETDNHNNQYNHSKWNQIYVLHFKLRILLVKVRTNGPLFEMLQFTVSRHLKLFLKYFRQFRVLKSTDLISNETQPPVCSIVRPGTQ